MAIELPKDAEGREIPLDTKEIYDENGNEWRVEHIEYDPRDHGWRFLVSKDKFRGFFYARYVYLEKPAPPDSWEKLEEDLDRCIVESDICWYYSPSGQCVDCAISDNETRGCTSIALGDIKERIRKLRGES